MLRKARTSAWMGMAAISTLVLTACAEREVVLPGERLNVRDVLESGAAPYDQDVGNTSRAVSLGAARSNAEWTQSGVSPHARISHAALSTSLQSAWSVSIGQGDKRRARLDVDPIVAGGKIFTVDSANVARAVSASSGEVIWSYDLTPERDDNRQAHGGGLAYGEGRLYVASGFGTLTALDPSSGAEIWVQRLGNSATGAPSVRDGVVYIVSGDQTGWALEADSGRIRWQIEGSGDVNNVSGAPAPAIGDKHVVFAFGAGTVQTAFRQGGLQIWNADVLGRRNGFAVAGVDDLTGDPLIAGERLYVGNHSGRLVSFALFDGERSWTARHGALGPVWPTGDSVFFVSDRNQLIRLDVQSGEQIWAIDLPGYKPERNPNKRRDTSFANYGPIMAGGRLVVAGSDGLIRSFAPEDGRLVSSVEIDGGATTRPAVAGNTLYVVSRKGVLHAFR